MKLDVHIIDIVVTSCHYCFASPRWQGESVNGEGQHWSHLTCLFLTGVIELPQYDCQGKRSQSRTKKKSKLRTACLTPNASSLYFFRISLCLIHFRFIFVSFHVFFAIFSRTQRWIFNLLDRLRPWVPPWPETNPAPLMMRKPQNRNLSRNLSLLYHLYNLYIIFYTVVGCGICGQ